MDRETDQFFNFTLIATDQGTPPLSFSTSVVITVGDENDNAPIFSPTFYNSEIAYNDECQVTVTTITATDADSGVNAVLEYYTTLNNNPHLFSLSSSTGKKHLSLALFPYMKNLWHTTLKISNKKYGQFPYIKV